MSVSCIAGVLAGGASKRLGSPKALLELAGGGTILEHVAKVAASVAQEVVILGQPPLVPPALGSVPILPDAKADCGPMAGLCSLLEYAAPHWGLLLACDQPALEASVLERLLRTAEEEPDADAVAFASQIAHDTWEACCALYHPRVRQVVLDSLRTGATGLQSLLRKVRTRTLVPTDQEAWALSDIDTAQDLDALGDLMA